MNLTDIIPAEAFIRSNRPGYRSPLDANIDFSSVDPKDFRSDPALIQSAVVQLKQMGFQVTAIGKSSIGLRGPKALFEATFKITLKLAAAEGARQERYQVETTDGEPYLISAKDTAFEEMIAGVLLVGTNLPASTNPETMSLSDIHKVMSYPKSVLAGKLLVNAFKPKGNGKDLVIVIEDGCYKEHSYFQLFQIQNNLSIELQVSDDLQGIKKNTFDEFYKVVESLNEMDETMLNFNDEEAFQEAQREMREAEQEMDRLLGDYKRYSAEIQSENDEDGHGTAVVAALTATIPSNSRVKVLRHLVADPKSNILNTFKQALSENPIVVNCSFVHFEDPAGLDKKFIGALFNLLWNKENETLFVFGAGNSEKSTGFITDLISVYTQIPTDNVLVVGGAYYDKMEQDTFPKLYASNAAHGFRSDFKGQKLDPIPHVCGICGPTTELPGYYIKVPRYSSDGKAYSFRNATSFAAPQITGICVAIKAVCPSIKPAEMKEIIMRTATPVPNKTTAQGISLTDITHKIKGDIIHPGLANGNLAVFAAQYYNLLKTGGGQVSVKEAVDYAKLIDEGI